MLAEPQCSGQRWVSYQEKVTGAMSEKSPLKCLSRDVLKERLHSQSLVKHGGGLQSLIAQTFRKEQGRLHFTHNSSYGKWARIIFHSEGHENVVCFFSLIQTIALAASPHPCHTAVSASPADVHQLVQLRAATLVHVPAALVALVHQLPQQLDHVVRCFLTDLLKLEHSRSLAVHVLGPLVQFEDEHLGWKGMGNKVRNSYRTTQCKEKYSYWRLAFPSSLSIP